MKLKYILLAGCLTLGACKKDVLDIAPTDRISETNIWTDPALVRLYVNAQYNFIQDGFTDIQYFGDEAFINADLGGYQQLIGKASLIPDNVGAINGYFNYYNTGYAAIRNLNIYFEKIDGVPADAATKTALTAEIKFLRAFVYSKLIWSYGGVPIIEKAFKLNEPLTGIKRNTYDECVAYILKDLNDAIAGLPNQQTGNNLGKASADAARALKARVQLYYASPLNNPSNTVQRWTDVSATALELINSNRYTPVADYHNLFISGNNSEIIFAKFFSTTYSNNIGYFSGPQGNGGLAQRAPTQNLVDAYEMTNGIIPVINGVVNSDPANGYNPANPYVNRDPRFYASVLYNGAQFKGRTFQPYAGGSDFSGNDATPTGYGLYKFIDQSQPVAAGTPYTNPWIFFRISEMYLIYAEAQYRLGNEGVARTYVNRVRSRVNMPPITEAGSALMDRIIHERQVELAFEGHRYFDVRRLKIAPQTEIQPIIGVRVVNNGSNFTYTRSNIFTRVWNDKLYYLPISLQEVRSSGGSLQQTSGY
ncbi:MAG: RagB/SusD family nutrient uptake outer membrane protein [Chryseobacterium sp.]|nr:MAG: RagB/SusD family nutrient uptake outer membrane protein [Chryseobacterium sp.]